MLWMPSTVDSNMLSTVDSIMLWTQSTVDSNMLSTVDNNQVIDAYVTDSIYCIEQYFI